MLCYVGLGMAQTSNSHERPVSVIARAVAMGGQSPVSNVRASWTGATAYGGFSRSWTVGVQPIVQLRASGFIAEGGPTIWVPIRAGVTRAVGVHTIRTGDAVKIQPHIGVGYQILPPVALLVAYDQFAQTLEWNYQSGFRELGTMKARMPNVEVRLGGRRGLLGSVGIGMFRPYFKPAEGSPRVDVTFRRGVMAFVTLGYAF